MIEKFRTNKNIIMIIAIGTVIVATIIGIILWKFGNASSKQMLSMLQNNESISIEVSVPEDVEQGTKISQTWVQLDQLSNYKNFRNSFDDALSVIKQGQSNKNGVIYTDLQGNWTGNSTLYNAFMNEKFVKNYWNNSDVMQKIITASKTIYSDVESDQASLLSAYNGYYNLLADSEPGYANLSSTLTRAEYMSFIFKCDTPVKIIQANDSFANKVGDSEYNLYAQNIAESNQSFLDYNNSSLDSATYNGTITRAEAIYTIVQRYYSDEYNATTGKEKDSYADTKNGGSVSEVESLDRWQAYELNYCIQNTDKGMPVDLYRAMVVASNHNLISGTDSRWDEGLTKGEALAFITKVYTDLGNTRGYSINVNRGASTGTSTVETPTVVETPTTVEVETKVETKVETPTTVEDSTAQQAEAKKQQIADIINSISSSSSSSSSVVQEPATVIVEVEVPVVENTDPAVEWGSGTASEEDAKIFRAAGNSQVTPPGGNGHSDTTGVRVH